MQTAFMKALELIVSGSRELNNILLVTAKMSLSSSLLALLIGLPIGMALGSSRFRGREAVLVGFRTLMGLPPVVCGLLFYMLFSGVGPLRQLKLLFTVEGMIIAQVVLITPVVVCTLESHVSAIAPELRESARGLGLSRGKTLLLTMNECIYQIISAWLLAFSRAIAEVGAVSMVGGAISWKTMVMTTAIMQYTNRGDFTLAVALGIILLGLSLMVNICISLLQRRLSA